MSGGARFFLFKRKKSNLLIDQLRAVFVDRAESAKLLEKPNVFQAQVVVPPSPIDLMREVGITNITLAMLAEGMQDRGIWPENAIADFKAIWPDAPVTTFENAGHFIQEDVPQALVSLIDQFIQSAQNSA